MSVGKSLFSCMAAAALVIAPLDANQALTLEEAVGVALSSHPSIEAARAGGRQAEAGVEMARAGLRPRLSYSESYMRSDNPVFVFGSLLNQRQFGAANFELARLNHPSSLQNFQSLVEVEQTLFDARRTKHAIRAARLREDLSAEERRASESEVILGVVKTYFGVILAAENLEVAEQSVKTAQADLRRAEAMFEAGMATKADALSVHVHLAAIEEQRIRAEQDASLARTALNDALGLDLDTKYNLTTPLAAEVSPGGTAGGTLEDYERLASQQRPALRQAALGAELAAAQWRQARSGLWPRVVAQGVLEADRQRFAGRGGGNWLAGVSMQWDVWKGSENRARVAAARHGKDRAAALQRRAASSVALQVRQAHVRLRSAGKRLAVSSAAVEQAEESHRIIQNRYQAGLADVTELIRGETALMSSAFRRLAALHELRVSRAALEHAAGNLTASSEALR